MTGAQQKISRGPQNLGNGSWAPQPWNRELHGTGAICHPPAIASAILANTDSWLLNMDARMINGVLFLDLCKAGI
jgi:hypothetical protein